MEEKLFALLEKMYSDLSAQIKDVKVDIADIKADMNNRFDEVNDRLVVIENKLDNNSKFLLDGYNQIYEEQTIIEAKVDNVLSELEIHELRIRQIKHMLKISSEKLVFKKI